MLFSFWDPYSPAWFSEQPLIPSGTPSHFVSAGIVFVWTSLLKAILQSTGLPETALPLMISVLAKPSLRSHGHTNPHKPPKLQKLCMLHEKRLQFLQ